MLCDLEGLSYYQIEFLIAQKMSVFSTVANTSILWWVTVIVFEATFIAGLITKEEFVKSRPIFLSVSGLGAAFILFSIVYAYDVRNYFRQLLFDISDLTACAGFPVGILLDEIQLAEQAITLGNYSLMALLFCLVIVVARKAFPTFFLEK